MLCDILVHGSKRRVLQRQEKVVEGVGKFSLYSIEIAENLYQIRKHIIQVSLSHMQAHKDTKNAGTIRFRGTKLSSTHGRLPQYVASRW
jgi:hypothetical protein